MNACCYCWVQRYGFSLTIRKSETIFFLTGWMCVYFYKGLHKWNNIQWFAYWHGWKAKGVIYANFWSHFCRCRLDARQGKNKGCVSSVSKTKKNKGEGCPCGAVSTHIFYPKFSVSFFRIVKTGVIYLYSIEYQCFILLMAWNLVFVPFLPIFLFFLFLLFFLFYFPVYCISASIGWQFAIVACILPNLLWH